MLHTPRSFADEIRAKNIEVWNDVLYRGLVWAVIHLTRSDLEKLGESYREMTAKSVSKDAQTAEWALISAFTPIIPEMGKKGGIIELDLALEMKEKLKWILPAIQYLYTLRYGDVKWWELNALLNTDTDEPYVLIFHLNRDGNWKLFIKKMLLERSNSNSLDSEKSE